MGWLFLFGVPYQQWVEKTKKPYPYRNPDGSRQVADGGAPLIDSLPLLAELTEMDASLDREFMDEQLAVIHFQLLVIVASTQRIRKEGVQFQRFLRESRFKLLANGVKPPADKSVHHL